MEPRQLSVVSLAHLAAGAAGERWDYTLRAVIENIRDANTDPKAKRTITLKVTLAPAEDRETIAAHVDVVTSMAHLKPYSTPMFMMRDEGGEYVLTGLSPQRDIEEQLDHTVAGKIEPSKGKAGAG